MHEPCYGTGICPVFHSPVPSASLVDFPVGPHSAGAPYRDPEAQAAVDRNPNLIFALTKTGGHVGHLQFPPLRFWRALTWSDAVVMQFVEAVRQRPCLSRPATR